MPDIPTVIAVVGGVAGAVAIAADAQSVFDDLAALFMNEDEELSDDDNH
jgi:hypothetical protein